MKSTRLTTRIAAWLGILAILMAALAPSLSHALAAAGNAGNADLLWHEICSSAGLKLVQTDPGQNTPAQGEKGIAFEHCSFCSTHAGMAGLPPVYSFSFRIISGSLAHPALFYHSPRPLFAWASAQSRAPPVRS